MSFCRAAAFAPINIALIKYWGKRDSDLNLPRASSLSVCLAELGSLSVIAPSEALTNNVMVLNDKPIDGLGLLKVARVMRAIRGLADGTETRAGIRGVNTVPTGQGLASSASAFAALAKAGCAAYGIEADDQLLSKIARLGSGSAARSIHGGWVVWHRGERDDGYDSFAEQVFPVDHWPLRAVIAHIGHGHKKVPSTEGMRLCAETSPYYEPWIESCEQDLADCITAVREKNFLALAEVVERNCLAMHAAMIATRPALLYWKPATLAVIEVVRSLRDSGCQCLFTIDAGPSVIVFATPDSADQVTTAMAEIEGVSRVTRTMITGGAHIVPDG